MRHGNKKPETPGANASAEHQTTLLEELLSEARPAVPGQVPSSQSLLGECIDELHPVMQGRVRVQVELQEAQKHRMWLAKVHGVTVRKGDRVIIQKPANYSEPIVTGVLDGLAPRRMEAKVPGPTVPLRQDESLRVVTDGGQEILEIYQDDAGPVVRLLDRDVDLELPGALRVRALSIKLEAEEGDVEVKAAGDVVVEGNDISLN